MASTCADKSAAAPPRRPRPNSGCRCFAFFCDGPRTFAPPTHCLGMETHLTVICECDVTSHCHRAWPQKSLCAHMHTKETARARSRAHACTLARAWLRRARPRPRAHESMRVRHSPHAHGARAWPGRTRVTHTHAPARAHARRTRARAAQTHRAHPHLPASLPAAHALRVAAPRWRSHLFAGGGAALPPACRNACAARARALNSPVGRHAPVRARAGASAHPVQTRTPRRISHLKKHSRIASYRP